MTELVVARYNEDLSWVGVMAHAHPMKVSVYNKGTPFPKCHNLPNVGREAHTYLHHITERWDTLADWTVFTQADPEPHTTAEEFLTLFPPSVAGIRGIKHFRLDGELKEDGRIAWQCSPTWFSKVESGEIGISEWSLVEFFNKFLGPVDLSKVVYYGGAIFAVSKANICRHPRSFYQSLLATVDHHIHPEEAHYLERAWHCIFTTRSENV
jgi:hypothetical protein